MTTTAKTHADRVTFSDGIIVTDASLLEPNTIWPDAIQVQGRHRVETFWRTQRTERDREGEVIAEVYVSSDPSLPELHVLND